jgi:hypothetical protein
VSISVKTPKQFEDIMMKDLQKKTVDFAEKIFTGVVSRSPVREGSFRANWRITQGSRSRAKFVRRGSVDNPAPAPSVRKLRIKKGKIPIIYVSNNSPYAQKLEDGSSAQAPYGIISATMASFNIK